ncbi:MAG: tetratricopeptide repeat protein, partial [Acidobacteriota bacterium]
RQQAIEVWSRIFLIDINNSEAVTRIEKARQDMAEGNRVISEGLKNGREIYERGDLAGARELFLQVLTADENEPTARFYLDRIQEEMANPGATPAEMPAADGSPGAPATAGAPKSAAAQAAASKERARKGKIAIPRTVLAVVGAFALLVLGGVYFFVLRAPRSGAGAAGSPAGSAPGSLARARQLLGSGKIGEARAELRRVPASSKDYAEAQKTLTELGKPSGEGAAEPATGAPMSVASETGAPPPAPIDAEPARMRAAAERHLAEKHYIDAMKSFSLAAPSFRNDPTFAQSMGVAAEKVTALTPAVKLYNEAEYETAIPILWRIYQEDRDNQDAKSYLLRAYYNQGITQLQNGMYPKAIESFNEALTLDATDSETIRHRKFAERYLKTDLDLMGRIYVRHLNHRP